MMCSLMIRLFDKERWQIADQLRDRDTDLSQGQRDILVQVLRDERWRVRRKEMWQNLWRKAS